MAHVIYNGNGSDGGAVPIDSNAYASGDNVYVGINDTTQAPHQQTDSMSNPEGIVTGNLTRTGATFLYWNTKADGSGTYHGPSVDSKFAFPNQPGDLTLFAQWAITTGLTAGGVTAHYAFAYDESLAAAGIEPARTNAVIASCEADFAWMQTQFAGVDISTKITLPMPCLVTALSGGASWGPLRLKPGANPPGGFTAAQFARCLMVAEVVEMFMLAQHKGWGYSAGVGNEGSCGEGLSLFLFAQFQLSIGLGPNVLTTGSGNNWLNSALPAGNPASTEFDGTTHYGARKDYVNSTLGQAGNGPGTGCSILFIYYLNHQLGFAVPDIIAAAPGEDGGGNPIGGACLRGVYKNLTGDDSDPFPYFANLLAQAFPPDQVAAIPGNDPEDPWPLGSLSVIGAKNTWGQDEIKDIIAGGGTYPDGLYLALDGFSKNIVGAAKPSLPAIAFGGTTTAVSATPPAIAYQSANPKVPQQILFAYDVKFAQAGLGPFPATGETPAEVDSSIIVLGKPFPAVTEFFFLAGADPYFTNVVKDPSDPTKLTVPWLSEDLRVFTATPGQPPVSHQHPVPGGPKFVENSVGGAFDTDGAYKYIQDLLLHLNQTYGDPGGIDPFLPGSNVIPQQETEFTADSSVTPFTKVGNKTYNNYSFAIARVRLRGSPGGANAAEGVKVFFRLWGTQNADTGWDPSYTYLSNNDGSGNPLWPEAPADNHTIPFFATSVTPDFSAADDAEFKAGGFTNTGVNNQTITIAQGHSQWAYFGCFLDVNDPTAKVNNVPIPDAFPGTHHCLVAQIAYAGAPIQTVGGSVPTPESSDQMAQRNCQVTTSDNPGPASAHQVPQTFDVRPSATLPASGPLAGRPDELMIDWGKVPAGSVARIYWPAVSSAEVIALAAWMYGVHTLSAADSHTIEVKTIKGVTYVPIPQGSGPGFAGLFTVDLPQTVKTGQEFNIVVRRIGKRPRRGTHHTPPPPPPVPVAKAEIAQARRHTAGGNIHFPAIDLPAKAVVPGPAYVQTAVVEKQAYERYIVGSFQVKIPVATRETMLAPEETTLAILKARLEAMAKSNRWYPVLLRYIHQIAERVDGLGGNAAAIPASLGGYRPALKPGHRHPREEIEEFTGKVHEVVFDCCGDFIGFVLDDCFERHAFESRECDIGELVLRALKERLTLMVVTVGRERKIFRLVVKA